MNPIKALRQAAGLTQAALAAVGGTSQPTVAAYESGRKSPTLTTVRRLARAVGLEASVEYHTPLTREERRSLFLHAEIAERLRSDPRPVLLQARRTLDRMRQVSPSSQAIREWTVILDRPVVDLLPVLTDPAPWARELRHMTPFAGVLTAKDRAVVYGRFAAQEARAS